MRSYASNERWRRLIDASRYVGYLGMFQDWRVTTA
jgi:hypothetical protein